MQYSHGKCFRVIWGLPGQQLVRSYFYPSRRPGGIKNLNFAAVKNFSWTNQPRPISKCKLVLDVYFRPFSSILEVMFFWKMAICEYLILVIFGQFWLFRADFAPKMWKVYLFQLFRCKNNNGTKKNGSMWLFQKSGPRTHPGPKNTKKWPQEGQNWRQCTSCGPTNWFWAKGGFWDLIFEITTWTHFFLFRCCFST